MASADREPQLTAKLIAAAEAMGVLVVARMIGTNRLDPATVTTPEDLFAVLQKLGRTPDDAFELHIERVPQKLKSIDACASGGDPESAVALLHTLIEAEVNTATRMILRIRGFSHSAISDALRGMDLKSKLNVTLPLMGVDPGPRIRQLASESQAIRNASIHFKAHPDVWTDAQTQEGDHDQLRKKAADFMRRNAIEDIKLALESFVDVCLSGCPEVRQALELCRRFRPNPSSSGREQA
jgi:hypothetical protein